MESIAKRQTRRRILQIGVLAGALLLSCVFIFRFFVLEKLNRDKCHSNLSALGQAMLLYANDYRGQLPRDLGTLAYAEDITPAVFICPDSNTKVPENLPPDQLVPWVNEHSDYVYIGRGVVYSHDPERGPVGNEKFVLAYDKETNHSGEGMNVLFGDGIVRWMTIDDARRAIKESPTANPTTPATLP